MNDRVLSDEVARRRIRDDLDSTLVVEAAAGTGKTTALVARVVSLIHTGKAQLGGIVAVTFTDKAAGEMKLRLRAEIEKARAAAAAEPMVLARFDHALSELETARIGTIHSLCADLLRERPIEARVDPLFDIAALDDARRLYNESFEEWFQSVLEDPPEGVRRLLRRRPRGKDARGPRDELREAGRMLAVELRDFDGPWRRVELDRVAELDAVVAALGDMARSAPHLRPNEPDKLGQSYVEVARFLEELHHRESVRPRDHDGLEALLGELSRRKLWQLKGYGPGFGGRTRDQLLEERERIKSMLDGALARLEADLAACLHTELRPLVERYERARRRSGRLDFLDLLVRARDLLRDDAKARAEYQGRFTHVLVDEFQDTDPLQAEILILLAAKDPSESDWTRAVPRPGKLFVVGDPKQSIYRFRRADVALYEEVKRRLLAAGAELIYLETSFRSRPAIQAAINAAFAPVMKSDGRLSQAEYVALQPFREDRADQPAIVALPAPRPYGDYRKVVKWKVEESLADAVGAFVEWLVKESGWTVSERDGDGLVPVQPRHICLLFKRQTTFGNDLTRPYVRALEVRRIQHVLVGGRSYHEREEVLAIRNALAAIEWPDDELSVYATLRGPFFALGDDRLLLFRERRRTLHPLRPIEDAVRADEHLGEVAAALEILRELHVGRNRRPISDTIGRLLDATRAHAGIAIWPSGEQALANILRVTDLARRFEAAGATSFRAFVERLEEEADSGEAGEAPVVEEGTEGVRMMTVHRAKGLEFPVVILIEPTAPPIQMNPTRWVEPERRLWARSLAGCVPLELHEHREEVLDRDRDEAVRLAYVAATRARDLLVVPVVGVEEPNGWLEVLWPAIYPDAARRRSPETAPASPRFGRDSVRDRPDNVMEGPESTVAPGLHVPRAGAHRVVWWDPGVLHLDKIHDTGLRQQKILELDDGAIAAGASEKAHAEWKATREETLETGRIPSLMVLTPTEESFPTIAAGRSGARVVAVETTALDRSHRPRGKRFGTLVHAVLASVPLDASAEALARVAAAEGRIAGAPRAEIDAAIAAARAALAHPLLERARRAEACVREAPVSLRPLQGTVIDGVVDLAFRELGEGGATWTVVDFKTDLELGERRAAYEAQLAVYAEAITAATGERAEALLLMV